MGTISSELRLDLKLSAMRTIGGFLDEDSTTIDDGKARVAKIEEYVKILEEEKRKIEAFKRELPLCLLIVSDVIGGFKEELEQCRVDDRFASAVEELMPMKRSKTEEEGGEKVETDYRDKINWMSSVQLWTDNYSDEDRINAKKTSREKEMQCLKRKNGAEGEAFIPFEGAVVAKMQEKPSGPLPELSLRSPVMENSSRATALSEDHSVDDSPSSKLVKEPSLPSLASAGLGLQVVHQPPRKLRRCWSPELHKRFISALQQLGGAQVATPKQIRELMKVEGLTNDEVKSHLQKYRLHTRRASNYSEKVNQPAVMLSGLWLPRDQYTAASSQKSVSSSMSPQSPLQLAYASRAISGTTGDSYDVDDGKSESHSWKQDL